MTIPISYQNEARFRAENPQRVVSFLHHVPQSYSECEWRVEEGGGVSVGGSQRDGDVVLIVVYPWCGWK